MSLMGIFQALKERATRPSPAVQRELKRMDELTDRIIEADRKAQQAMRNGKH